MSETLFISHSVYLTPEERKILATQPTTIETVGMSVPANPKDLNMKLTEVFVRYLITTETSDKSIELMPDGYKISFPHHTELKPILNLNEGGSEWLLLQLESEVERKGIPLSLHHQIIFKDVSVQERTTICEQLGHFLQSKKK
jgi:hypothetical protein